MNLARPSGVLLLLASIAGAGVALRCSTGGEQSPEPVVPNPDVSGMEPQVVRLLQQARESVLTGRNSADAWGELGSLYDAHMLTDLAEVCYRRARSLDPDDFRWVYLLAIVREIQGAEIAELRELFDGAAAIRPSYTPIHVRLGDSLWRRGQYGEARDELRRAIELAPGDAMAHRRLGQVLLALGETRGAAEHLTRAVNLEPRDLAAYSALAQALMRLGQTERAREVRESARGLEPVTALDDPVYGSQVFMRSMNSSRAFARAMAAIRQGAHDSAIEDLGVVLEVRPHDASAHYWMGTAYQRIGELQPAMTHLFEAVRLEPRMVQARLQLAALLSGQSRHAEGVEQYERAAVLRPLDAEGHYGLGLAYEGSGRLTEARDHYRAAVRLDPGHVARSRLESQGTDFSPSPE